METLLIDTGPVVALLDRSDVRHEWAVEQFSHLTSPLATCEGVICEATHLLLDAGVEPGGVLELMDRELISIRFDLESNLNRVLTLMKKYADTPMDFVDACLVVMTEAKRDCRLLTLDSDFRCYRRFERQAIPLITPAR
jgi:predicted nucleic acid-binding protein